MKTVKKIQLFILFFGLIAFNACVEDDEFEIPNTTISEPDEITSENVIGVDAVAGIYIQEYLDVNDIDLDDYSENDPFDENISFTFDESDQFVEGYVISSDKAGNFFEEVLIQDKVENPTFGIKVLVDVNPLFTSYEVGRKIYVRLQGLTIGIDNGVLTLGVAAGDGLEKIPAPLQNTQILRSSVVGTLVPKVISLTELYDRNTNQYVTIQDAQFNRTEVLSNSLTYAAEPTDEFDGERTLESCAGGQIVFSTSTFSDFKGLTMPSGRGTIVGILNKNFFGDEYNFVINSPEDIIFDNTERCDPVILDCGVATMEGTNILFEDDFSTQSAFSPVSGNGWTNYIEAGSESWEAYTSGGTNASQGVSVRMSAFGTNDDSNIAWLITPPIDLDNNTDVTFSFETSNSFSDESTLELLFSNDWDGTTAGIATATWGIVEQGMIVPDDQFFGDWVSSGIVDLSCGTGTNVYFAFRYTGSDTNSDLNGTYELDNIKFAAN